MGPRPPLGRACLGKTQAFAWFYLVMCLLIALRVAISSAPPGKGPWPLRWRLLSLAQALFAGHSSAHVLRQISSWTEAQRADWVLLCIVGPSPLHNVLFFFFLPTFDVTGTTWPLMVVFHMLLGAFVMDLPPMHLLVQLCIAGCSFSFLDFQKALSLAQSRSSDQLLLSDTQDSAAATQVQAALHQESCRGDPLTCYALYQGLPMLLLGVAAAIIVSTVAVRNHHDVLPEESVPRAETCNGGKQQQQQQQARDVQDSDSAAAVPLESLGIFLFSSFGVRPLLLRYHCFILHLASRTRHMVLGAMCAAFCAYYWLWIITARFNSVTPVSVSGEEILLLTLASYVIGRDSSKMDASKVLQHIQSRLMASQALLVDMLPTHLIPQMLKNVEKEQQQQQWQQQDLCRRHAFSAPGPEGQCQEGACQGWSTGVPDLCMKLPTVFHRRPTRRASAQRLLNRRHSTAGLLAISIGVQPEPEPATADQDPPILQSRVEAGASGWLSTLHPALTDEGGGGSIPSLSSITAASRSHEGWLNVEAGFKGGGDATLPGVCRRRSSLGLRPLALASAMSKAMSSAFWSSTGELPPPDPAAADAEATDVPRGRALTTSSSMSSQATASSHDCVTVFFSDICGFSSWAGKLSPQQVMSTLDELYSRLDDVILNEYPGLYKVETIGDAYIVAANLLTPDTQHAATAVRFAVRARQEAHEVLRPDRDDGSTLEMRIGLHSGSIMSGIVGKIRRRFCLFGDTMNMASRTESSCPEGGIQLTAATYELAEPLLRGQVELKERGEVVVKGSDKPLKMFLVCSELSGQCA